ncbi:MAG: 2-isopropylmalate synthase [Chloroflexi bacterium CG07_land_8_20_14_0_80_51_10]|nr:MAG: 2-isopropylmalate synthase [Chloroflexi bacterium CG07_land_8_20_14_0_80_51_10]
MEKVIIFDTTLRDGEQSAGGALTAEEKLEIAKQLDRLGVDVIEAGFPLSSKGELEAVRRIATEVRRPTICALAHAQTEAVDAAWESIKDARHPRIHVFLSSSDIHIFHQLKKSRDQILEASRDMVARAKGYLEDVEFSPMDATRTDPEYIYRILEAVIEAGATTVNIPDTVGYTIPQEFCNLIDGIFKNVPNIHHAVVSVHCHNDLGLAVANSLAVLDHGARQIECTINGIGERAGNASLEEIVMAIKTRNDLLKYTTDIDTTQIYKTSRLVSDLTGMSVQPNKAIVGANAFRHESGIHQDGIIKERTTYEIMDPESIGLAGTTLSLGKLSGRHAFRKRLEELGYALSDEDLSRAFSAFKELADKKREITDRDLEALVAEELRTVHETYHLEHVQVSCGDPSIPTASVRLTGPERQLLSDAAQGTGPVDAVYKAINRLVGVPNQLIEFSVKSVTEGIDAIGEVTVRIESEGKRYAGRGAHTDIIVASARAYMNALNRLLAARR